jgi:hypothetical protein
MALLGNLAGAHNLLSGWLARRGSKKERELFAIACNPDGTPVTSPKRVASAGE